MTATPRRRDVVVLAAAGTALILDATGPAVPRVLHWGADPGIADPPDELILGTLPSGPVASVDAPVLLRLLPQQSDGWAGRPGITGDREGRFPHLRLELVRLSGVEPRVGTGGRLLIETCDAAAGVSVDTEIHMEPSGVVRMRHKVTNDHPGVFTLGSVTCVLPTGDGATEVLDFTGRWSGERAPQRGPLRHGLTVRESRRGRTGHDATGLLIAGEAAFGFRHGDVWAVHAGWSGNHVHYTERLPEHGPVLGAGELLTSGEIRLARGESHQSPWIYFAWSDRGLDGLAERLHRRLRDRPNHPRTPRPVVLNTWEAVYFDHRLDKLTELAEHAAHIGVERFVLDDGWFTGRRDDTIGLGDWAVDRTVWPQGLHPLVKRVRELGMQFGLWVEPEMVSPDSDLARAHPDWLLAAPGRPALPHRSQQVLDLARPDTYAYILARLHALVDEYELDYLKWDHNRDLLEAIHAGTAGVHAQTLAGYRLLDELRARHPHLEIESCSSGGARIDYGILERTDRVWVSDTIDPLERQAIQRWTGLLVPPELLGCHVGAATAHTTGRSTALGFRLATALFGHAGIEWDLTACTDAELDRLGAWVRLYKRLRPLLHTGRTVHADHPDPSSRLHGVVAADRLHAVYSLVQLTGSTDSVPARLRFPGLDPQTHYTVSVCPEIGMPTSFPSRPVPWITRGSVCVSGSALATVGLAAPLLDPAQAVVMELRATTPVSNPPPGRDFDPQSPNTALRRWFVDGGFE
ncbi:alpha-galactosidase [Embleya scabrispora]|uniref:alpha-galactosidase n=1 Tax=Embleya scabrispora TaxID=159449 RepID=UPI000361A704|nr:alpha-galactosidase [Embleya scabrispora]MYS84036.1 alpha-galactosidase [Streptomyces sp. SID5474]